MLRIKEQTKWSEVCPAMAEFIEYCRALPFADEPNYEHLIGLLRRATTPTLPPYPRLSPQTLFCDGCTNRHYVPKNPLRNLPIPVREMSDDDIVSCPITEKRESVSPKVLSLSSIELSPPIVKDGLSTGSSNSNEQIKFAAEKMMHANNWMPMLDSEEETKPCPKCSERRRCYFDQEMPTYGLCWHVWRNANKTLHMQYNARFRRWPLSDEMPFPEGAVVNQPNWSSPTPILGHYQNVYGATGVFGQANVPPWQQMPQHNLLLANGPYVPS
jgi:hypothetical protein